MNENPEIEDMYVDESSLHKWRTELPNIVFDLGLDVYEFRMYCELKKIAGDKGACWKSMPKIAKSCGMCLRKAQEAKKALYKPRSELGGKSLIRVKSRVKENGLQQTDIVYITDLWGHNLKINSTPAQHAPSTQVGTPHSMHPHGAPHAHKEDLIEEDPRKKKKKGAAAAGAPSQTADAAARISSFLADEIKERYPNNKPKTKNWIKEIELMLRIDGRSEEKVIEVLKWVRKSRFWRKTILSPTSLRNSFDRLQAEVEEEKNSPEEEKKREEKKKLDMVEENKKYAQQEHKKNPHPKIRPRNAIVELLSEKGMTPLAYNEHGFKEQLKNAYTKMTG